MKAPEKQNRRSTTNSEGSGQETLQVFIRRHLKTGWAGLGLFIALGIFLEALHAMKIPGYLSPEYSARRLMWTLAHTHGTLFSLVLIALGLTVEKISNPEKFGQVRIASKLLHIGWVCMPLGFFLGGVQFFGGDPGWGIFMVPIGAVAMLLGVIQVFRSA
jgi:hypothetical protein